MGEAQEPDLPAASYDLIGSSAVLFFLPDPAAALAAWRRLLGEAGFEQARAEGGQVPRQQVRYTLGVRA